MGAIAWHKNISVGINELDEQHKKIIDIINQLYDIIANLEDKNHLKKIIDDMNTYTQIHFATEEKYFWKFNYPGTIEHISEHKEFIKKLDEFKEGFNAGTFSLSFQIMDFLQEWLVHHIINMDKKYSAFLQEKGVK